MNRYEPTEQQKREWAEWMASRPPSVQKLCDQFQPWGLYLLKSSGHRVFPLSFNENGTVTVMVSGKYNYVAFERQVFGISPADLVPCELPPPEETVGAPPLDIQAAIIEAYNTSVMGCGNPGCACQQGVERNEHET